MVLLCHVRKDTRLSPHIHTHVLRVASHSKKLATRLKLNSHHAVHKHKVKAKPHPVVALHCQVFHIKPTQIELDFEG